MNEILSPETVANLPVTQADEFLENSTTAEMRPQISLHRTIVLITLAVAVSGWFFVPSWIDWMAFEIFSPRRRKNGSSG